MNAGARPETLKWLNGEDRVLVKTVRELDELPLVRGVGKDSLLQQSTTCLEM